ncbi:MAG: hypothetical protein IT376_02270 [Polyangiaceae bacterium]|nr:hypothetical protein [Polyangiaceae bacterium]
MSRPSPPRAPRPAAPPAAARGTLLAPARPAPPRVPSTPPPRAGPSPRASIVEPTLLVVGAPASLLGALTPALGRHGAYVESASAADAVEAAVAVAPDLIALIAESLPGGGAELLTKLLATRMSSVVPIAIVSDDTDLAARLRAFRDGAAAVIPRTASVDALAQRLVEVAREAPERPVEALGKVGEATLDDLVRTLERELRSGILSVKTSGDAPLRLVLDRGRPLASLIDDFVGRVKQQVVSAEVVQYEFDELAGGSLELLDTRALGDEPVARVDGLRVVLADDDVGRADAVASELRARGAVVVVTDLHPSELHLSRLRQHDPAALVIGADHLRGAGYALLQRMREDARLRWAALLVVEWEAVWSDGELSPVAASILAKLAALAEPERLLASQVASGAGFDTRVEAVGPARLLRLLGATRRPLKVIVANPRFRIELGFVEGLLAGAEARVRGERRPIVGVSAIAAFLVVGTGRAQALPVEDVLAAEVMAPVDVALAQAETEVPAIPPSVTPPPPTAEVRASLSSIDDGWGARASVHAVADDPPCHDSEAPTAPRPAPSELAGRPARPAAAVPPARAAPPPLAPLAPSPPPPLAPATPPADERDPPRFDSEAPTLSTSVDQLAAIAAAPLPRFDPPPGVAAGASPAAPAVAAPGPGVASSSSVAPPHALDALGSALSRVPLPRGDAPPSLAPRVPAPPGSDDTPTALAFGGLPITPMPAAHELASTPAPARARPGRGRWLAAGGALAFVGGFAVVLFVLAGRRTDAASAAPKRPEASSDARAAPVPTAAAPIPAAAAAPVPAVSTAAAASTPAPAAPAEAATGPEREPQAEVPACSEAPTEPGESPASQLGAARRAIVAGDLDRARTAYCRAVALDATSVPAALGLATILLMQGAGPAAREVAGQALALRPADDGARQIHADALAASGDEAGARAALLALAGAADEGDVAARHARTYAALGAEALRKRDGYRAERMYRRAAALAPSDATAAVGLARALLLLRRPERAAFWARRAIPLGAASAAPSVALGDALAAAGDRAGAREAWSRAAEVEPTDPAARERTARAE